jgi:molecular chaperone DnaK (HSP70)
MLSAANKNCRMWITIVSKSQLHASEAVLGWPVRFVNSAVEADDTNAIQRFTEAFKVAGITDVHFEFEPVATAYSMST